jgi:nicotinate-nucleotide adenylyltransferase
MKTRATLNEGSEAPAVLPRIGIFGGTFDPPHVGHLIIAAEMRHALSLDRLLFVPAGLPPHKPGRIVSDNGHRLAMLTLALANAPEFEVSTVDLDQSEPSYTSALLGRLQRLIGPARLYFLMGEDSLRDYPTWHEPEKIVALAELAVATRILDDDYDLSAIYGAVPSARGRVHLMKTPVIDISSSDLRARVAEGRPIRFQVPPSVEAYIRHHGLYALDRRQTGSGQTTAFV